MEPIQVELSAPIYNCLFWAHLKDAHIFHTHTHKPHRVATPLDRSLTPSANIAIPAKVPYQPEQWPVGGPFSGEVCGAVFWGGFLLPSYMGIIITHTIHVWYIYLHLRYFAIKNNQM